MSAAHDTCNEQVEVKQEETPENDVTRVRFGGSGSEVSSCGDQCERVTALGNQEQRTFLGLFAAQAPPSAE